MFQSSGYVMEKIEAEGLYQTTRRYPTCSRKNVRNGSKVNFEGLLEIMV
jgi:hypothetical protein